MSFENDLFTLRDINILRLFKMMFAINNFWAYELTEISF